MKTKLRRGSRRTAKQIRPDAVGQSGTAHAQDAPARHDAEEQPTRVWSLLLPGWCSVDRDDRRR
jgi:hypothetical protein